MSKSVLKVGFAGAGADSGLHVAAIADFAQNIEVVDGRRQEKTSFHQGEPFFFLVQHDPKLYISDVRSSWGAVQRLGPVSRPHSDDIQIATLKDSRELSYIPAGTAVSKWYGNSPQISQVGRTMSYRSGPLPAIGTLNYSSHWQSYRLVPGALSLAAGEEWPVLIVVYLEVRS